MLTEPRAQVGHSRAQYRAEIDGLRAIAVMPVLWFHSGLPGVSGGFIGVDIFFVISGYLITQIISRELDEDTFTFASFYERRVRRIAPALIATVLAVQVAMFFVALPDQLNKASEASWWALLGVSNIYFWSESGYFSPASEFQPLLHTWSLGVEEQFYLLLPISLVAFARLRIPRFSALVLIVATSFALSVWLSSAKPSAAFYLLPTRAWELGIGGLLGIGVVPAVGRRWASLISLVGLGLIVLGLTTIGPSTPFPGWAGLLPSLGAAAIIYASNDREPVGRVLSLPPLRFIGLMSYSLYLWHWPVFTTLRMAVAEATLPMWAAITGVLVSLIVAAFSWRFVEQPFRSRSGIGIRRVLATVAVGGVFSSLAATAVVLTGGFPQRLDARSVQIASASRDIDPLRDLCVGYLLGRTSVRCVFGADDVPVSFVLVGDSHAAALRPAVAHWAQANHLRGELHWLGECPYLPGAQMVPDSDFEQCARQRKAVHQKLLSDRAIKTVILGGRWLYPYTGFLPESGGSYRTFLVEEGRSGPLTDRETKRVFKSSVRRAVRELTDAGKQVIIIGPSPEPGFDVPTLLGLRSLNGADDLGGASFRATPTLSEADEVFKEAIESVAGARYISIWRHFCTPECQLMFRGRSLYSDDDHLSYFGASQFLGPTLTGQLP